MTEHSDIKKRLFPANSNTKLLYKVHDGMKINQYFGTTIRCEGAGHMIIQCLIPFFEWMTCSRCVLKKQTFLALNVALIPAHESPYGQG